MADVTSSTGALTTVTDSYIDAFSGYTQQFIHYGKEIFTVLLIINITWIALWYAFDKDSLAAGMSSFLKKFTIASIFYSIMIYPQSMGSLIDSSTQMGLAVTKQTALDPSSIITVGANVAFEVLKNIHLMSFMFNASYILMALIAFFILVFCFMSVALQVAVTQVVATALAMFSCFTLGFSALGATEGIARKSIDALICACFKLLGYYVVIGASVPVFNKWNAMSANVIADPRQQLWLCSTTLMFWLLSKSLAGVFERVGGGLIGETAGVDFAALAVSAAKTAAMALSRPKTVTETMQTTFNFNNYASMSGPGSSSPTPPAGSTKMVAAAGGQASNDTYKATGGSSSATKNGATSTPHTSSTQGKQADGARAASQSAKNSGKVINFNDKLAQAENKRTYPEMGQDKQPYKVG